VKVKRRHESLHGFPLLRLFEAHFTAAEELRERRDVVAAETRNGVVFVVKSTDAKGAKEEELAVSRRAFFFFRHVKHHFSAEESWKSRVADG